MSIKKLSLNDFEAVPVGELLEVKGGASIMHMPADDGGVGCCCGGYYIPIDGSGIVNATNSQIAELGRAAEDGWNASVELAEVMWNISTRNAEALIESVLPLAIPPVYDLPIYNQEYNQEYDLGPTSVYNECN
ncbi:hypothetical protein GO009_15525 [Muricauda sp. TY007]|uniref:hypothetical protein n=1 Tax=Allomuricauda sp. TY007 TaxID=2683200 RepID=UPI0013C24B16|nr:hypothetical protein [Muricauda sp. TY007]NDV17433.1 hypothetical protein [Muricauda sp. TY007]